MISRRSLIAAALTIVAPGMGQLYLGLPKRAVAIWVGSLALTAFSFYGILSPAFSAPIAWLLLFVPIIFMIWAAWDALRRARTATETGRWYQRWYVLVLITYAVGATLRPYVGTGKGRIVRAFRVPSGSMAPTMVVGDYVYADMRSVGRVSVTRGSIVTFLAVDEPGLQVMKRVVALSGDTVAMRDGHLLLNGTPADEPYVMPLASPSRAEPDQRAAMLKWQEPLLTERDSVSLHPDLNDWGPLVMPHETLLVLGDNRQASYDSRYWGPLPQRNLLGRPRMVYYSYDVATGALFPFLTAVRWSRLGLRPT